MAYVKRKHVGFSGIDLSSTEISIDEFRKAVTEMASSKVKMLEMVGTLYNGRVVLDNPIEYISSFPVDKRKFRSLKEGKRYNFEVGTVAGVKPEVMGVKNLDIEYWGTFSIVLNYANFKDFKVSHEADLILVKALHSALNIEFSEAREKYVEVAKEKGSVTVTEPQDLLSCLEIFDNLNSVEFKSNTYSFFSMENSITDVAGIHNSNEPETEGEFVGNFYLQSDIIPLLEPIEKAFELGERFSLLFTGEAGYGKTSAFKAIAEKLGKDLLYVDCSTMLNTTDWFGHMQAKDGSTKFEETQFTEFLRRGNCVIIWDEFNRLSIEVANSLLPILDDRGFITVKNDTIVAGNGILFGITLNEGIEYTGIGGMLDKAIKSRIYGKVDIVPLPYNIECDVIEKIYPEIGKEMIENIVTIMHTMRDTVERQRVDGNFITADVSTRTTKMVAWWVSKGLDIRSALDYALFNFVPLEEKVTLLDNLKVKGVF